MEEQHSFSVGQVSPEDLECTPEIVKSLVELLLARVMQYQALSKSESCLTQFLEATPIGIVVHDSTGQLLYINHVGQELLGTNHPSESKTDLLFEVFPVYRAASPVPCPIEELPSTRALAGETVKVDDLEIHRSDRVVPLDVWATPIFDDGGQVLYAITAFQDITERRCSEAERQRVEQALLENESRYRQVVETQTDFILRSLSDTTITFANKALCRSLGCSLEEITGQKWIDFGNPEDLQSILQQISQLTPENPTFIAENRDNRADGEVGWTQWINQGIFNPQGELVEIQSVGRDITALKQVEAALRESEARFRNIVANVPGAIFRYLLRPDGSDAVLYISAGCYRLWEIEAEEVEESAKILWDMIHPDDLPAMYASVMESALNLQPWFWKWRIITRSGQVKWLESAGRPERNSNGDVIWDTLILDVSARKQAEIELQQTRNFLQNVIDHLPVAVFVKDGRAEHFGKMLLWNKTSELMFGITARQAIGKTVYYYFPKEQADFFLQKDRKVFESGIPEDIPEEPINSSSLGRRILHTVKIPLYDFNHLPLYILCFSEDITNRKQTEVALQEQTYWLSTLIDAIPDAIYLKDGQGRWIVSNQPGLELFQLLDVEYSGKTDAELSEFSDFYRHALLACARTDELTWQQKKIRYEEEQIPQPDGSVKIIDVTKVPLFNSDGSRKGIVIIGRNISDRKRAEEALQESEERYRLLAENINDLVCLHQPDGRYIYVSPSCESLLGYRYDELVGQDPYTLFHPEDRDRIYKESHVAALAEKPAPITYRMRQKSGNYVWFETLTKAIVNATGQIVQLQTTSRNVTERVQVQNRLRYDALHDTLTGLPNRNLLMERLELAINRAKYFKNYHFAVLFLDLDRFKVVNDSLGHLAGDQLLIVIARKLQSILQQNDLTARLGGDEFVILLDEIKDIQEAVRATERIFAEMYVPLMIEGREIYITTSIGIVFGTKDYVKASHLLRDADIAMYRAKNRGKARYEIFDAEMHTQALKRLHLENDFRQALERQEFVLYYQPIIALDTNLLVGFEALIRWQHPTQGLKSPGEFIAMAEETGLITPLDYWVLHTACQQLATWQAAFPDISTMKVSVNLSAQDLRRHDLLEEVDRVLAQTQLDGRCLALEITESMLIEDVEATIILLEHLKKRGIEISIDDFGTGYSSLSYLHRLPVDNLKVDRSFVNQMSEGRRNHQIVETIVALSQHLELDAIAEGIETPQQLERLQQLGYKFGQGYLFSEALSQEAVEALLLKSKGALRFATTHRCL